MYLDYEVKPYFIQTALYRRKNGYEFYVSLDGQRFEGFAHTRRGAYRKMRKAIKRHNSLVRVADRDNRF